MEQQLSQPPSVGKTFIDVISSPEELFEGYASTAHSHILWIIPLLVSILITIAITYVMYSNEVLRAQLLDAQRQALEQQVQQNKMTQEQADTIIERMESANIGMYLAFGAIGITVGFSIFFFLGSLVLWLANKFILHTSAGYLKHLEVYGISTWISIIGSVVSVLLMLALGSIYAHPAASIVIYDSFDVTVTFHRVLAALNVFSIWQTVVLGIALAKLSQKPLSYGIALTGILWLLWIPVSIMFNLSR